MAGLIREEDIALVRERADLAEVIGNYVTLPGVDACAVPHTQVEPNSSLVAAQEPVAQAVQEPIITVALRVAVAVTVAGLRRLAAAVGAIGAGRPVAVGTAVADAARRVTVSGVSGLALPRHACGAAADRGPAHRDRLRAACPARGCAESVRHALTQLTP